MIVVDTSALMAIPLAEEEAGHFTRFLITGSQSVWSAGTALEAFIVARRKLGDDGVSRLNEMVSMFALRAVAFGEQEPGLAKTAYERYGRSSGHPARLNFGDCFSYALAKSLDAPLLFKGDDFVHTDIRAAIRP